MNPNCRCGGKFVSSNVHEHTYYHPILKHNVTVLEPNSRDFHERTCNVCGRVQRQRVRKPKR